MRVYEELFIVKPDAAEEEVDGFVEQLKTLITTAREPSTRSITGAFASSLIACRNTPKGATS